MSVFVFLAKIVWRVGGNFEQVCQSRILSAQRNYFAIKFPTKKWFSIVFGLWTKTAGFWRKNLTALSKLLLTCPGETCEEIVFFSLFWVQKLPDFESKKTRLSTQNTWMVRLNMLFTCKEETFETTVFLRLLLFFLAKIL